VSGRLRITADPARVSMARAIERLAPGVPLFVLSHRALADLARELGSERRAARWLARLAGKLGRPILVNAPTGGDTSSTVAVAPRGWGEERLLGWLGGHHAVLEEEFGPVARIRRWDGREK
jgi:hypothetical protein